MTIFTRDSDLCLLNANNININTKVNGGNGLRKIYAKHVNYV